MKNMTNAVIKVNTVIGILTHFITYRLYSVMAFYSFCASLVVLYHSNYKHFVIVSLSVSFTNSLRAGIVSYQGTL